MKSMLLLLTYLVSALGPQLGYGASETKEFPAKDLETLNLKTSSGDVNVSVSTDGKAHVKANKVKFDEDCTLTMERTGNALNVSVEKEGWFGEGNCKVHLDVKVPKEIAMDLKSGSGDLKIDGTSGNIEFILGSGDAQINADMAELEGKSGSGNISVEGTIGEAEIKTGSGSIKINGLMGSAELKTGSGDVDLTYKKEVKQGEIDIKTGSGDATIILPSNMKILTNFKSGSGRVYNEIGDTADAAFKVSMKAGSGDLKIKKL